MLTELEKEYFRELAKKYSHLPREQLKKLIEEEFEKLKRERLNEKKRELDQKLALKKIENRIKDLKSSYAGKTLRGINEDLAEMANSSELYWKGVALDYEKQKLLYELGLIDEKPNAFTFYLKHLLIYYGGIALVIFLIYLLIKWLISK